MDTCPISPVGEEVSNMIHSDSTSTSELSSFNFDSFQASLMTSCVPPFQCGSFPSGCGSSNSKQSGEGPSLIPCKEDKTSGDCGHVASSVSASKSLQVSDYFDGVGDVSKETTQMSKDCMSEGSVDTSVVVKQPLSGDNSSFCDNISSKSNQPFYVTMEDENNSKMETQLCVSKPDNEDGDKEFDNDTVQRKSLETMEDIESLEKSNYATSSKYLNEENTTSCMETNQMKSNEYLTQKEDDTPALDLTKLPETQRLFTPEDLRNEQLHPNPHGVKSEIYQNLNAKEADFVLEKPRRKPRDVSIPTDIEEKEIDFQERVKGGIIVPLATENDVALNEGSKELLKNGQFDSVDHPSESSDNEPCEAVNFVLENNIDNFDREEYVNARVSSNLDIEMPSVYESQLLQLLISKRKTKRMPIKRCKKIPENSSTIQNNETGIKGKDNPKDNTKSVPNLFFDSYYDAKFSRSRAKFSRRPLLETPRRTSNRLFNGQLGRKYIRLRNSPGDPDEGFLKTEFARQNFSHFNMLSECLYRTEAARERQFENAPKQMDYDITSPQDPFLPQENLEDCSPCSEKSKSLHKSKTSESQKLISNTKGSSRKKFRDLKSTKFDKSTKYNKITDYITTSVDGDIEPILDMEDRSSAASPSTLTLHLEPVSQVSNSIFTREPDPLLTYSEKGTPKTTMDLLEEVQANLRARLASLECLDSLVGTVNAGNNLLSSIGEPQVPYQLLGDAVTSSITAASFTPPSSSSPSPKDSFEHRKATRKKNKRKYERHKKRGKRRGDETTKAVKAFYSKKSSASPTRSSSSSLNSSSDESSASLSSPQSSPRSSSTSSSSSSSDSSSSSGESSDIEDTLI